jgi:hypothetical protein
VTNTRERAEGTCPIVYQCRLSLSTRTVNHLADLLRRHLKAIRSRWRILAPGKIAVIVLAALRHDQHLADMASGSNVSESTVRRWRDELIGLLAAQAPRLARALKKTAKKGGEAVLIDGTLIRTQRHTGKADRRNYLGKHRSHGLHFLALTDENGRLIWISAARPGRTHDNTAARHDHILAHLRAAGLGALADLGFRGLDNPRFRRCAEQTRARIVLGAGTRLPAPSMVVAGPMWACGSRGRADHGFRDLFVIVVGVVWSVVGSGLTDFLEVSNTHS